MQKVVGSNPISRLLLITAFRLGPIGVADPG